MPAPGRTKTFFDQYTRGLTPSDFQRLFTHDTAEAYRYFTRHVDTRQLDAEPFYRRWPKQARLIFGQFTMRLSPARRVLYGLAVVATVLGLVMLFRGFGPVPVLLFPFKITMFLPQWADGALWLGVGFIALNLLILMEVADRLSLKGDLEIARDIQLAMLPGGTLRVGDAAVCGVTRPANTVGGDFYDVLALPDGRIVLALGDVAGKGSPAALLMALLLAMLRTLVDEGLETSRLVARLNAQVARHAPPSRFITLFYSVYDPRDGSLQFVNAGHLPPVVRRADGRFEKVGDTAGGGLALGMFEQATYSPSQTVIAPGDMLVLYSDGITEAENALGKPFDESGLEAVITDNTDKDPEAVGRALLKRVEAYAADARLGDDLTALVLKRTAAA